MSGGPPSFEAFFCYGLANGISLPSAGAEPTAKDPPVPAAAASLTGTIVNAYVFTRSGGDHALLEIVPRAGGVRLDPVPALTGVSSPLG